MGKSGAVMVADGGEEDLRFVLQPSETLAVDDAVAVAHEIRPHGAGRDRLFAAAGLGHELSVWGESRFFALFDDLAVADFHSCSFRLKTALFDASAAVLII
jgi:hypothetical protein